MTKLKSGLKNYEENDMNYVRKYNPYSYTLTPDQLQRSGLQLSSSLNEKKFLERQKPWIGRQKLRALFGDEIRQMMIRK